MKVSRRKSIGTTFEAVEQLTRFGIPDFDYILISRN